MPSDGGPIYAETQLGQFPVEPWNTYSEFVVLGVVLYWVYKTRTNTKEVPVTVWMLLVLFLQFTGASLYHATRAHAFWLLLDVAPILGFVLGVAIRCMLILFEDERAVFGRTISLLTVVLVGYVLSWSILLPGVYLVYFLMLILVSFPLFASAAVRAPASMPTLVGAIALFGVALVFREIDRSVVLFPMGTHFLWHIGAGLGAGCLLSVLYQIEKNKNGCTPKRTPA